MARYTEWLQKKFVGDPKLGAEYLSLARTLLGGLHNYSKNVMSNVRHVTLPNGVKITVSFAGAINRVLIDVKAISTTTVAKFVESKYYFITSAIDKKIRIFDKSTFGLVASMENILLPDKFWAIGVSDDVKLMHFRKGDGSRSAPNLRTTNTDIPTYCETGATISRYDASYFDGIYLRTHKFFSLSDDTDDGFVFDRMKSCFGGKSEPGFIFSTYQIPQHAMDFQPSAYSDLAHAFFPLITSVGRIYLHTGFKTYDAPNTNQWFKSWGIFASVCAAPAVQCVKPGWYIHNFGAYDCFAQNGYGLIANKFAVSAWGGGLNDGDIASGDYYIWDTDLNTTRSVISSDLGKPKFVGRSDLLDADSYLNLNTGISGSLTGCAGLKGALGILGGYLHDTFWKLNASKNRASLVAYSVFSSQRSGLSVVYPDYVSNEVDTIILHADFSGTVETPIVTFVTESVSKQVVAIDYVGDTLVTLSTDSTDPDLVGYSEFTTSDGWFSQTCMIHYLNIPSRIVVYSDASNVYARYLDTVTTIPKNAGLSSHAVGGVGSLILPGPFNSGSSGVNGARLDVIVDEVSGTALLMAGASLDYAPDGYAKAAIYFVNMVAGTYKEVTESSVPGAAEYSNTIYDQIHMNDQAYPPWVTYGFVDSKWVEKKLHFLG